MCKLGDGKAINGKSFMDECIARDGRALLWKLTLKTAVRELKWNNLRLYGIIINCEIMCLNVYIPCGGR